MTGNRAQRRKAKLEAAKHLRALWKKHRNVVEIPEGLGLADGVQFTVKGVRLLPGGSVTHECEPGAETVFTGKIAR